jgi:Tol biopolymer transport system component
MSVISGALALVLGWGCVPKQPRFLPADEWPSWSPVGDSIAFVHTRVSAGDLPTGIYVLHLRTGVARLIRSVDYVESVDWAPDGSTLVFGSFQGMFTYDLARDRLRKILDRGAFSVNWSPDGNTIAFDDGDSVYLMPSNGGVPSVISPGRGPSWSPDGTSLVIRKGFPAAGINLIIITPSGQLLKRLTSDLTNDTFPAWSPSGTSVAWLRVDSYGTGDAQIWRMDTSGANASPLVHASSNVSWSPDGSRIVFSRTTAAGARLFIANSDGSELLQLTR